MPSLLMYGLLALAVMGALAGIYEAGSHSGAQDVRAEWARQADNVRKKKLAQAQKAAEKKEAGDAKAKIVYRTIYRDVDRIVERPSYASSCLDPDGLRLARSAIRGELDSPVAPQPLRSPARTSGRNGRLDIALDYGRF